jgi:hypothetical protein
MIAIRFTTSGASTPNMALSASAASERLALPQAERARDLIDLGPVSTTALIGLPRVALRGCSTFDCRTCWGRSGDALIRSQFSPSALTADSPGCASARARRPPMPNGVSGSDNSIAETLLPPPNPGRGRSIAPFRIDASRDQNSAGKYPLISRPTQISTRVGVIHDMAFFLLGCGDNTPFLNAPPPSAVKQHFA